MRKNAIEKLTQTSVQGIETSFNYLINHISGIQSTDSQFLLKAVQTICKYLLPMEVLEHLNKINSSITSHYASSNCLLHARRNQDLIAKGYIEQVTKWLLDYNH
ncbi:hypothetical protein ILUMI_19179 [Ignelater luminosus]|uniref:Uncharacterized protein n=1 Tax=Ignelater luminosus TaxID=2038154 RepID=A0A8K0G5Q0_IGNLU|nr:hypothetical protein ILUMI_19179 [Ignelater luminosus]